MLFFIILVLAIILFCLAVIFFTTCLISRRKKGKSNLVLITFTLAIAIMFIAGTVTYDFLYTKYTSDPTISYIDIAEIYKTDSNSYVVKDSYNNIYTVPATNVFQGEKNQIICYIYPKLTERISKLLIQDKCEYMIVLTNPENIPKLLRPVI